MKIVNYQTTMRVSQEKWDKIFKKEKNDNKKMQNQKSTGNNSQINGK